MKIIRTIRQNLLLFIVITCILAIIFIYLFVYFLHFNVPSSDISDYSAFATYISGLGSLASIGALLIVLFENNKIRKEKIKESKKQNILYLVEHFEINTQEIKVFNDKQNKRDFIDNTEDYSENYFKSLKSVFDRINSLYDCAFALYDYVFMDQIKYAILNKTPANVIDSLIKKYNDKECIDWLRMDNGKWKSNLSMKKEDF